MQMLLRVVVLSSLLTSVTSKAARCPDAPVEALVACLEKAKTLDEVVDLLPKNGSKNVCDTFDVLKESSSPQGEDINHGIAKDPPQLGFVCMNGKVFLRMTTDPAGPHFQNMELLVRNGSSLVPLQVIQGTDGHLKVEKNPKVSFHQGSQMASRSCTECHGSPPILLHHSYSKWPNYLGSDDDVLDHDEAKLYRSFLDAFLKRGEPRFKPIQDKIRSMGVSALPPYNDPESFSPTRRPGLVLSEYAQAINSEIFADKILHSNEIKSLQNTVLYLLSSGSCPHRNDDKIWAKGRKIWSLLHLSDHTSSRAEGLELLARMLEFDDPKADLVEPLHQISASLGYYAGSATLVPKGNPSKLLYLKDFVLNSVLLKAGKDTPILKEAEKSVSRQDQVILAVPVKLPTNESLTAICEKSQKEAEKELETYLAKYETKTIEVTNVSPTGHSSKSLELASRALTRQERIERAVGGMKAYCIECHKAEMTPDFFQTPEGKTWIVDALKKVKTGEMPHPKAAGYTEYKQYEKLNQDKILEQLEILQQESP